MKNAFIKVALLLFVTLPFAGASQAQSINYSKFGKGLQFIAADSSFSTKIGFRFQTLYNGNYNLNTDNWSDQFMTRRARLKFDGFAYSPKVVYKFELGFSNRDTGGDLIRETNFTSNIVLDAVVKWNFYRNFWLWAGQTKLPGNRERVISSQKLQFVDRSHLNSRFNLDRDAGLQLHHEHKTGNVVWREIASVSMGNGRNVVTTNVHDEDFLGTTNLGGYDYTARIECLPFGKFESGGDYVGSDLAREETPKLSVAATYDFNDDAPRERGQLGKFMSQQRDLRTVFVDAMFKYRGISVMAEYADRNAPDGSVVSYTETGSVKDAFYTGTALNVQSGYLFKNNIEVAGRYTYVHPEDVTQRADYNEY
ncbi:MAG: OprO/OprP family phosphate-selective porin, partial [Hymenobacteraceae bacterium]|nr:OprO/OprP family phosphate-selective porin [Hymenobacteraceae bacterium]MDX5395651.1 OprO/OprP family phosphate-selective porin [Hymenobacteraceae bacterium]MDX5444112.1 OprO/OprP family phosphate-selective porin [Hymenobacteraceae bacterium]MDX5511705.1 OprO/OprP family phosphate-selective porin [Hymenobacteraceae bacterium]